MANNKERAPSFNDIVFELRNKEYGAYRLRKKYNRNVIIGSLVGILMICTAVIAPHIYAKAVESKKAREERQVEIVMENLDQPTEQVAPPPPPPPPAEAVQQISAFSCIFFPCRHWRRNEYNYAIFIPLVMNNSNT